MERILNLLDDEDNDEYIEIEKNDKSKNKVKIDSLKIKVLFDDGDDYIEPPHPHLLRIPFSLLLIAPKGSGKTTTIHNLMVWYNKMFDSIFIFSPTVKIDKKWQMIIDKLKIPKKNVYENLTERKVTNLIERIKKANEPLTQKKKIRTLFIFDDSPELLPKGKKVSFINKLAMNHRHLFISHIIVSQSFKKLDTVVRLNTTGIILYNTDNTAERMKITEELAGNLGRKKFEMLWLDAVKEKFGFMYINYDQRLIYKNFDTVIGDLNQAPQELMFNLKNKGITLDNKNIKVKEDAEKD